VPKDVKKPASGFQTLGLSAPMLKTLDAIGYVDPSPIQVGFIPIALTGGDCTGQARTGTGKTAAFVIPTMERIDLSSSATQAIVLTPTRELSEQVAEEARKLAGQQGCRIACCVGGREIRKQIDTLKRGVQIVVGTPGRVIDLINRGVLQLDQISIAVLDEADRMLDIGFRPDIEKILRRCPEDRQTLLLSATMPEAVERLAKRYMRDPQRVDLSGDSISVEAIQQYYVTVDGDRKFGLLVRLLAKERPKQAIVFTRTKRGADQVHAKLEGRLPNVAVIHGDLPQTTRDRVMKRFRDGTIRLLIATDVMGRGIDVSGISHIVNYDVPEFCDDYVHRIGRTGRLSSGSTGAAYTFVTREEGPQLTSIEKRTGVLLDCYEVAEFEAYRPKQRFNHNGEHAFRSGYQGQGQDARNGSAEKEVATPAPAGSAAATAAAPEVAAPKKLPPANSLNPGRTQSRRRLPVRREAQQA
jgi:ATP-dependent RNA helicase DeaD